MNNPFAQAVEDEDAPYPQEHPGKTIWPPREMYYEVRRSDGRFVHLYKGPTAKEKAEKDARQRNRFADRNDQQVRFHVEEVPKP